MRPLISFVLKLYAQFLNLLPRRWVRAFGGLIGFLWIDVLRFRRQIILNNLNIAFPEWPTEKKIKIGRQSVYAMGHGFAEFFLAPALNEKWLEKNVVFHGAENILKALEQKKGVYFLTLHLGNGDLATNAIVMKHAKISLITKTFKNKLFNDVWFSIRGAQGVEYIDAHGSSNAFDILKALKKNHAVVFVLDQFMGKPFGIATRFFGRLTGTAYGLALFALKTKSPIMPVYTYEGDDAKMHIVYEPALDLSPYIVDDKDETLRNLTQHFNDQLERIIRLHPEQWMWVHRRWKDFE